MAQPRTAISDAGVGYGFPKYIGRKVGDSYLGVYENVVAVYTTDFIRPSVTFCPNGSWLLRVRR